MKVALIIISFMSAVGLSAQDFVKADLRDTADYFKYADPKVVVGQKLIFFEKAPICRSYVTHENPVDWYDFDSLYNFMANNSHLGFKITFHNYSSIATPSINMWVSQLTAKAFIEKYQEDGFGNMCVISEGVGTSKHEFVYQNRQNEETIEQAIKLHRITFGNKCEIEIIEQEKTKFEFSDSVFILGQEKEVEIRRIMRPHQLVIEQENQSIYDSIYQFLDSNSKISVSIIQHTDTRGSAASNQKLSEARVNAIKAELISRGIPGDRIEPIGKGESEPIHSEKFINQFKKTDPNKFEQLHQINRRTIIRITQI